MRSFMDALHGDDAKPLVHSSIRVLLSTEDIDGYSFPLWACKPLNLPRPDGDMDRKDPIAPHIYKLYVGMLEIGKTLLPMKGAELTDQLKTSGVTSTRNCQEMSWSVVVSRVCTQRHWKASSMCLRRKCRY